VDVGVALDGDLNVVVHGHAAVAVAVNDSVKVKVDEEKTGDIDEIGPLVD